MSGTLAVQQGCLKVLSTCISAGSGHAGMLRIPARGSMSMDVGLDLPSEQGSTGAAPVEHGPVLGMLTLGSPACSSSTPGRGSAPAGRCSRTSGRAVQQRAWLHLAQRGSCSAGCCTTGARRGLSRRPPSARRGPRLVAKEPTRPSRAQTRAA